MNESLHALLSEATVRKTEIATLTQKAVKGQYVALYESEEGTKLSLMPSGIRTQRVQLSFRRFNADLYETALSQVELALQMDSFLLNPQSK